MGKLDRVSSQSVEEKNMSGPFASVTTRKDSKAVINRRITARVKYLYIYIKHNFAHIPKAGAFNIAPVYNSISNQAMLVSSTGPCNF